MDPLRQQILELWLQMVQSANQSRRETANKYKTKKIMLRAHGIQTYYEIIFQAEHQALSHHIIDLKDARPLEAIPVAPQMIGFLGAFAEAIGQIEVTEEETKDEEHMKEDMFFEQHFSQSLSETLGELQGHKNQMDFNA